MSEDSISKRKKKKDQVPLIDAFTSALRSRQISGSYAVARQTAKVLRNVVSRSAHNDSVHRLLCTVRDVGNSLQQAAPLELSINSITTRILCIIREENTTENVGVFKREPSLCNVYDAGSSDQGGDFKGKSLDMKAALIQQINELLDDLVNATTEMARHAPKFIHNNDVILTVGHSESVLDFLIRAAEKNKKFEVWIAENAPQYDGYDPAVKMSKKGIVCKVITDASIFPLMPRVTKVIVGAHALMANGGILATAGTHSIALAASHYSTPFVVCSGTYKLAPFYAVDQESFNERKNPSAIIHLPEVRLLKDIYVYTPRCDYVPPELIDLLITNQECIKPSYIYRLLSESYDQEDYYMKQSNR